jgi:hypothetical protein
MPSRMTFRWLPDTILVEEIIEIPALMQKAARTG